jgi:hypothetical protein
MIKSIHINELTLLDAFLTNQVPIDSHIRSQLIRSREFNRLGQMATQLQPDSSFPRPIIEHQVKGPQVVGLVPPQQYLDFSRIAGQSASSSGRLMFPPGYVIIPATSETLYEALEPDSAFKNTLLEELIHCASIRMVINSFRIGQIELELGPEGLPDSRRNFLNLPKFNLQNIKFVWADINQSIVALLSTPGADIQTANNSRSPKQADDFKTTELFTEFIGAALRSNSKEAIIDAQRFLTLLRGRPIGWEYAAKLLIGVYHKPYINEDEAFAKLR